MYSDVDPIQLLVSKGFSHIVVFGEPRIEDKTHHDSWQQLYWALDVDGLPRVVSVYKMAEVLGSGRELSISIHEKKKPGPDHLEQPALDTAKVRKAAAKLVDHPDCKYLRIGSWPF